jgi:superfamily II DNA or RNA helicase
MSPGSIVSCRNRDWVLLPADDPDEIRLRPLTGATDEVVALNRKLADLAGDTFPAERVKSSQFPPPAATDISNASSAHLLWQSARLTLREGAAPFRSLGRVSIRPRTYQFVPLLMALRLETVRLLIADDVGVGKTIEAGLIAREMWDRGEIRRLCVLCPPYLCEQWQKELSEKFNLDAVIIRSGTVGPLERKKSGPDSIYRYYPIQIVSIDFVKSERNRHAFLQDCPDLVIVDEAHGSAFAEGTTSGQHQRHHLVKRLADKEDRHLILLSATPHSGVDSAFRSLLGLLQPQFVNWDTSHLDEAQRIALARHFVQRTRKDITTDWEGDHCFPDRDPRDETYRLSTSYRELFEQSYDFCAELVRPAKDRTEREQRVRYWAALALLRCVMSSPAAAMSALENRHDGLPASEDDPEFRQHIFESSDDRTDDSQPTPPLELARETIAESERRRLRELGKLASALVHSPRDSKLARCIEIVADLIEKGFRPILWCRYIATADYLAAGLQKALQKRFPGLRVLAITGTLSDDERRTKVEELSVEKLRVLVATDCLSEGINLQHAFDSALHYDLPWNPNRLEQREGRVDRYGQRAPTVRTIRYFSPDSAVDGVVIDVLLNKAREIHKSLGTHVPVPEDSESVTEAVLKALFLRGQPKLVSSEIQQLELGLGSSDVEDFHRRWDIDANREKLNRTRFAQRALKPAEVARELEATDAVLGDPEAVRSFVLEAAQRLGMTLQRDKHTDSYTIPIAPGTIEHLPEAVRFALPKSKAGSWHISFASPTPEGAEYLGRNHRFVTTLAQFLMEEAMTKGGDARASRCGVIRTRAISKLTTLLLLRVRHLLKQPGRADLLAEEVHVIGYLGAAPSKDGDWLPEEAVLHLLASAEPDANISMEERRELVSRTLTSWPALQEALKPQILARATALADSHRRIRQAVSMRVRELKVEAQLPPDLLGVLILQPLV